jgi:hypothetical protein
MTFSYSSSLLKNSSLNFSILILVLSTSYFSSSLLHLIILRVPRSGGLTSNPISEIICIIRSFTKLIGLNTFVSALSPSKRKLRDLLRSFMFFRKSFKSSFWMSIFSSESFWFIPSIIVLNYGFPIIFRVSK